MMIETHREHQHRDPDQRDVIGFAGIEDGAAETVLRSDELADDGAGQRQPDIHAQHRDDPRQAGRHDQLAKNLPARRAERIEQLLAVRIERLDAGIGGQRRHDEGQGGRDGDLRRQSHAEHQDHQRRQCELRQGFETDHVGLHDRRIIARPPERQAEQRAQRRAEQKPEDGRAEGEADVGPGIAFGEELDHRGVDRARLRPEEAVDPAEIRRHLPERDGANEDAGLNGQDDPERPILLHRQAPRRSRRRRRKRRPLRRQHRSSERRPGICGSVTPGNMSGRLAERRVVIDRQAVRGSAP